MVVFLLALVPSLAILYYYYNRDRHPEPWGWVAMVFILGAWSIFPAILLENNLDPWHAIPLDELTQTQLFWKMLLIPGLIEEAVKLLVVLLAVYWRSDFDEPVDGLIYGTAAALGFTFAEDLRYYLILNADWTRIFGTVAHPWFSCFWAAALGWAKTHNKYRGITLVVLGLVASATIHGIYDYLILAGESDSAWTWTRHLIGPLMVGLYLLIEWKLDYAQKHRPGKRRHQLDAHAQHNNDVR